jgi:hypothetical protein
MIVPALREMHVAQPADHLEFNADLVLGQEVGGIFANDHVVAKTTIPRCWTVPNPDFRISWARAFREPFQ